MGGPPKQEVSNDRAPGKGLISEDQGGWRSEEKNQGESSP